MLNGMWAEATLLSSHEALLWLRFPGLAFGSTYFSSRGCPLLRSCFESLRESLDCLGICTIVLFKLELLNMLDLFLLEADDCLDDAVPPWANLLWAHWLEPATAI